MWIFFPLPWWPLYHYPGRPSFTWVLPQFPLVRNPPEDSRFPWGDQILKPFKLPDPSVSNSAQKISSLPIKESGESVLSSTQNLTCSISPDISYLTNTKSRKYRRGLDTRKYHTEYAIVLCIPPARSACKLSARVLTTISRYTWSRMMTCCGTEDVSEPCFSHFATAKCGFRGGALNELERVKAGSSKTGLSCRERDVKVHCSKRWKQLAAVCEPNASLGRERPYLDLAFQTPPEAVEHVLCMTSCPDLNQRKSFGTKGEGSSFIEDYAANCSSAT